MPMLNRFASALRNLLGRPARERDLDEELRAYVHAIADERMRRGA